MDGSFEAVERLLGFENGTLSAPTGFGRIVIGAAAKVRLKMSTLWDALGDRACSKYPAASWRQARHEDCVRED